MAITVSSGVITPDDFGADTSATIIIPAVVTGDITFSGDWATYLAGSPATSLTISFPQTQTITSGGQFTIDASGVGPGVPVIFDSPGFRQTFDIVLVGGENADTIGGSPREDTISGGDGNDSIDGESGADSIDGGDGDDIINTGNGNFHETVTGGAGNDSITASVNFGASSEIDGGSGDDTITGTAGDDTILGGTGNDVIDGLTGTNSIAGGDGNDSITVSLGFPQSTVGSVLTPLDLRAIVRRDFQSLAEMVMM